MRHGLNLVSLLDLILLEVYAVFSFSFLFLFRLISNIPYIAHKYMKDETFFVWILQTQ